MSKVAKTAMRLSSLKTLTSWRRLRPALGRRKQKLFYAALVVLTVSLVSAVTALALTGAPAALALSCASGVMLVWALAFAVNRLHRTNVSLSRRVAALERTAARARAAQRQPVRGQAPAKAAPQA